MTVAFQELSGSPIEHYSLEGFHAERHFLIAWADRDAFAVEVLGVINSSGQRTWAAYPGKSSVFAASVHYEPFDPEGVSPQTFSNLTHGVNNYGTSLAKATVTYKLVNTVDRTDAPSSEIGTHLTYRMTYSELQQPLTLEGWSWVDVPSATVPDDLNLVKSIPITEHELVWQQVVLPPWETIRALQGKINANEFLSCPAGTLLFMGAKANKLYTSGYQAGASEYLWELAYLFREKSIKQGSQIYGWNHVYRGTPAGWAALSNGNGPVYDSGDFNPLFQSASV